MAASSEAAAKEKRFEADDLPGTDRRLRRSLRDLPLARAPDAPAQCPVCEEERQYVKPSGQQWTTFDKLQKNHRNSFQEYEPGVIGTGSMGKNHARIFSELPDAKFAAVLDSL